MYSSDEIASFLEDRLSGYKCSECLKELDIVGTKTGIVIHRRCGKFMHWSCIDNSFDLPLSCRVCGYFILNGNEFKDLSIIPFISKYIAEMLSNEAQDMTKCIEQQKMVIEQKNKEINSKSAEVARLIGCIGQCEEHLERQKEETERLEKESEQLKENIREEIKELKERFKQKEDEFENKNSEVQELKESLIITEEIRKNMEMEMSELEVKYTNQCKRERNLIYFIAGRGFETEVFLGIPFAKPPVGELRFEKPQPPVPWDGILEAKTLKPPCITHPDVLNLDGQEDCLYLNLVRPKSPSTDPNGYPVMFFIHGGAFLLGTANHANYEKVADRIVSKGVIFIAVAYRIGVLGFYTTGDEVAPGNYGIWDQIRGLEFVHEVIRDFGGDPDNVTILGESAGACSTSVITIYKEAESLFKRSIIMSGSTKAQWVINTRALETSNRVNEILGVSGSSEEKKKKLKELTAEELINGTKKFIGIGIPTDSVKITYFNPRVDGELIHKEIVDDYEGHCEGLEKKETLIGLCSQEDIALALPLFGVESNAKYYPLTIAKAQTFSKEYFIEALNCLLSEGNAFGDKLPEAVEKILSFYFDQRLNYSHNEYLQAYVQLLSDIQFNIPAMREAIQKHKAGHQVYFYVHDFPEMESPLVDGASHASDIITLFGFWFPGIDKPLEGEYEKFVDRFAEVLVSFAKNGVPTYRELTGSKITDKKIPFIQVGNVTELKEDLWPERLKFWDDLAKEFGYDWPGDRLIGKDGKI
ncbi:hypothetical protein FO519_007748 [Halicephalobus sp. NKZ332]|nr:hypothetical protein FO519_007748 [Halicephalobus sp. NKZ332]